MAKLDGCGILDISQGRAAWSIPFAFTCHKVSALAEYGVGYFSHKDAYLLYTVIDKFNSDPRSAKVQVDWCEELLELLQNHMKLVNLRIQQFSGVEEFVREIESLISVALQNESETSTSESFYPRYYIYLVDELEHLGWQHVDHVNDELTLVKLTHKDRRGVEHLCAVEFNPSQYQTQPPKIAAVLPEDFPETATCGSGTLFNVFKVLEAKVEQYQDLWAMLDELDAETWVIEPKTPDPSATYRRIVLEENCSVQIRLNVQSPRSICDCKFLGKDSIVKPLLERFNREAHQWDWKLTVFQNLSNVLGIKFPQKEAKSDETFQEECGICYMSEIPGPNGSVSLPSQYCGKCGRPYHTFCLSEWLRSLPSTHRSFDTMFGKCVYCSTEIKVQQELAP